MNIRNQVRELFEDALERAGFSDIGSLEIEHPADLSHGDYACNSAMQIASKTGESPREIAERIIENFEKGEIVDRLDIAGPGFINIWIKPEVIDAEMTLLGMEDEREKAIGDLAKGKKIMIEFTDPNPFKQFHIGHLMTNTIGESLARLYESQGAEVIRANYQGDVGPHVAKALWGMKELIDEIPNDSDPLESKTAFLGKAYALGAREYEESPEVKTEIDEINRTVYQNEGEIMSLYTKGREWSLAHFEELYKKLDTRFDHYFFEGDVWKKGLDMVEVNTPNVFQESDGALIFDGESHGLHTRVFKTALGLPTYEAKEIGLNIEKFETEEDLDESIIITGNEQTEYFKVVLKAIEQFRPDIAEKTSHIGHGMMRAPGGGKMASRSGDVITGEGLLGEMSEVAKERSKHEIDHDHANIIAVAGIRFDILKQQAGKNIIFDKEKALSFEGDSGPYLQYTHARCNSLIQKSKERHLNEGIDHVTHHQSEISNLERLLLRLPEVVEDAYNEKAPHVVTHYLLGVAREFNSWYGETQIIVEDQQVTKRNIAVVSAVKTVLAKGLYILGIHAPESM
jgi:arginyl-tRNA synthetase